VSRPLLITDCDEVLLHMVAHFRDWVGERHAIDFALDTGEFAGALTHRADGAAVAETEVWPLLEGFFATEMARQTLVPGAAEALRRIGEVADIVILTNIGQHGHAGRVAQLADHGIHHRVRCNSGGKGPPALELIDELRPSVTAFVDDLPVHHASMAKHAPHVWRLHMVAEPEMAPGIPPARHAHARIDDWSQATEWILARFEEGVGAPRAPA
jgi:hypothetical protein